MLPRIAPEYDQARWLLKALREAAHQLESLLWDLNEQALCWRPAEDEWSLKEISAHLRDREEYFMASLESIAFDDSPRLPAFKGDALAFDRAGQEIDLYEALEGFEYLRHRTVNLLWSMAPEDWESTGEHPYLGPMSVVRLTREQYEHDLEHLWQARRLRDDLPGGASRSL